MAQVEADRQAGRLTPEEKAHLSESSNGEDEVFTREEENRALAYLRRYRGYADNA
jgi:hypothetical protein